MNATYALVIQRRCSTFAAARFLKRNGWPLEEAVQLLARRRT